MSVKGKKESVTPVEENTDVVKNEAIKTSTVKDEIKHQYDVLKANSFVLFDVGPEVVAGATYNNRKETYTKTELAELIKKFLGRGVE